MKILSQKKQDGRVRLPPGSASWERAPLASSPRERLQKILSQMVMIFEVCAMKNISSSVMVLLELLNECVFWWPTDALLVYCVVYCLTFVQMLNLGHALGKEVSSIAFKELIEVMALIGDSLQFIFFLLLNNLVFLFSLPFWSFQNKFF